MTNSNNPEWKTTFIYENIGDRQVTVVYIFCQLCLY